MNAQQYIETVDRLVEKSNYLKLVRPFCGLISRFDIDTNNKLMNMDTDLQVEFIDSSKYFSVYECYADCDVMLPGHKHDVDETIIVLNGELTRVENGNKFVEKQMCCINKFEHHTFFIKAGSKFLCIFYPPIDIERVR